MKILLIEDDIDIASNVGQYFEDKGHRMDFAYNGTHGLTLANSEHFEIIILDLMLPGKDGISLCREFRQNSSRDTPILMLTARDTLEDKISGFEAGSDDYLVKPFSLRELEARIHRNAACRRVPQRGVVEDEAVGLGRDVDTKRPGGDGAGVVDAREGLTHNELIELALRE